LLHLLKAMYAIACSDGDLHTRELRIIQKAAKHWGLSYPADI